MILAENIFSNKRFLMVMNMVFIMVYLMSRHNFRLAMKICVVAHSFFILKETWYLKNYLFKLPATTLVVSAGWAFCGACSGCAAIYCGFCERIHLSNDSWVSTTTIPRIPKCPLPHI